jgi:hypothetical protein
MFQTRLYSLPGRPSQTIALIIYVIIVSGLSIAALLEAVGLLKSGMDPVFFLLFLALIAPIGLLVLFLIPNTSEVHLREEGIVIYGRKNRDFVPYEAIKNVSHIRRVTSGFTTYDMYRVDFYSSFNFGKTIYFRSPLGFFLEPFGADLGKVLLYRARLAAKKRRMNAETEQKTYSKPR